MAVPQLIDSYDSLLGKLYAAALEEQAGNRH